MFDTNSPTLDTSKHPQKITINDAIPGTQPWAAGIVSEARESKCTTVGLTCGSRQPNDRRVIDSLARTLSEELKVSHPDPRMLVIRITLDRSATLPKDVINSKELPKTTVSPLGQWSDVEIPMNIGKSAPWTLEQLPRWLPKWKNRFSVVLIDLGPMHLVPSRTIGRLCDGCYVLLGPDSCGSHEWILQHMAWHDRAGSTILGTLVSRFAA